MRTSVQRNGSFLVSVRGSCRGGDWRSCTCAIATILVACIDLGVLLVLTIIVVIVFIHDYKWSCPFHDCHHFHIPCHSCRCIARSSSCPACLTHCDGSTAGKDGMHGFLFFNNLCRAHNNEDVGVAIDARPAVLKKKGRWQVPPFS